MMRSEPPYAPASNTRSPLAPSSAAREVSPAAGSARLSFLQEESLFNQNLTSDTVCGQLGMNGF